MLRSALGAHRSTFAECIGTLEAQGSDVEEKVPGGMMRQEV